jgi:hypothetical protein
MRAAVFDAKQIDATTAPRRKFWDQIKTLSAEAANSMMAWAGYPSTEADSPERRTSPRPSPRHLGDGAVGVDGAGAGAVAGSPSPFPQLQRALARLASSVVSSSEAASELEPSPDRGIAVQDVGGEDQGEGDHELQGAESALLGMCGARRMGHDMLLRERPLLLPLPPPPPSLVCPLFCPLVCPLFCPLDCPMTVPCFCLSLLCRPSW